MQVTTFLRTEELLRLACFNRLVLLSATPFTAWKALG
jgi:hypothetical protein